MNHAIHHDVSRLTEMDIYLFKQGNHTKLYEKLGSHLMTRAEKNGVCFAVWAPNAVRVSVVGTFNGWDGRVHPMRSRGASGVWELFVPGLDSGELYKYEIRSADGSLHVKADPYAQNGLPPTREFVGYIRFGR